MYWITPQVLTLIFVATFNVYCNLTVTKNDIAITNFFVRPRFPVNWYFFELQFIRFEVSPWRWACSWLRLKYGPKNITCTWLCLTPGPYNEPAVDNVWSMALMMSLQLMSFDVCLWQQSFNWLRLKNGLNNECGVFRTVSSRHSCETAWRWRLYYCRE
jgi:hypothetical protein